MFGGWELFYAWETTVPRGSLVVNLLSPCTMFGSQYASIIWREKNQEQLSVIFFQNGKIFRILKECNLSYQDKQPKCHKVSRIYLACTKCILCTLHLCIFFLTLRYSYERHGSNLKQRCNLNGSQEDFWSTISEITIMWELKSNDVINLTQILNKIRYSMSEEDIKDLLFSSWSPTMASLFRMIKRRGDMLLS